MKTVVAFAKALCSWDTQCFLFANSRGGASLTTFYNIIHLIVALGWLLFSIILPTNAYAQPPLVTAVNEGNGANIASFSPSSGKEFWHSCMILGFGLIFMAIEYRLIRLVTQISIEKITRIYTITLIIIGTLVLIASGITNEQIASALGLFGTIVGHLLGKSELLNERRKGDEDK